MRYLPLTPADRESMLQRVGVASIDDLFANIPADKLLRAPLDLPRGKSEPEVARLLGKLAGKNLAASAAPFFAGCGAYSITSPPPSII